MSRWWNFVVGAISPDTSSMAAQKIGVNPATLTRWKQGTPPDAPHVVAFARAYQVSSIKALIAAGILTADDVSDVSDVCPNEIALADIPLGELLAELRTRLEEAEAAFGDLGVLGSAKGDKRVRGEKVKRRLIR